MTIFSFSGFSKKKFSWEFFRESSGLSEENFNYVLAQRWKSGRRKDWVWGDNLIYWAMALGMGHKLFSRTSFFLNGRRIFCSTQECCLKKFMHKLKRDCPEDNPALVFAFRPEVHKLHLMLSMPQKTLEILQARLEHLKFIWKGFPRTTECVATFS